MAKLSGAVVLLLLVVPLCMFTCALLVGIQLGRALERRPGSVIVTLRSGEALGYVVVAVAEELWDTDISGRGRDESASRHPYTRWVPLPLESNPNPKAYQGCNRNHTSAFQLAQTLRDRIAARDQMLIQKQQHLMLLKLHPPKKQAAASQQAETTRIAAQEQRQQMLQKQQQLIIRLQQQQLMQAPRRTNPPEN